MHIAQRKTVRVLFDEWHSESWSCSIDRACEFQPENPAGASYQLAASALAARDFIVARNVDGPISGAKLAGTDILVFAHPCDPRWERTTSLNSPALSADELVAVQEWVRNGGALLAITEYEHDKYGDNLNELLSPAGLRIENGKVFDRTRAVHENPEWFLTEPRAGHPLGYGVDEVCFYRAGWITAEDESAIAFRSSPSAFPPEAAAIAATSFGLGRIAVVTDSVLFGDECFSQFDHAQLWLNLLYWLAATNIEQVAPPADSRSDLGFSKLKMAVNELRLLQAPDGTLPAEHHSRGADLVGEIAAHLACAAPDYPHLRDYLSAAVRDFSRWRATAFQKPDFANSLAEFRPQAHRCDGLVTIAIFPQYTPNASSDVRFEAIHFRTPWPDWLGALERRHFPNPKFVPGHLLDHTAGYAGDCAVLFPETVSVASRPTNQFATIFCDREAARLQAMASRCSTLVNLPLHPELEFWLRSRPLMEDTFALWDLIHDASHSLGELPFDPFMIRQRAPFWMYGLEELRVDLRSFGEAQRLVAEGFPFARFVTYAIVLDRIFRFPLTGKRVRNYDALGGQLLFAYLHQGDFITWSDGRLTIDWKSVGSGIAALREELRRLYKFGSDCSKMTFWLAAHDLISRYVPPNVASKWKASSRAITDEADPKRWLDLIEPDEFPLGAFHLNLQRALSR